MYLLGRRNGLSSMTAVKGWMDRPNGSGNNEGQSGLVR